MRRAFKYLCVACFLFGIVLIVLMIDLSPSINTQSSKQVQSAESVQQLLDELRNTLRDRHQAQDIELNLEQAESLAGFLQRAIGNAQAEIEFTQTQIFVRSSYEYDTGLFPIYVNLAAIIDEGRGLQLNEVSIGDVSVPGNVALSLAEDFANSYTKSTAATKAIETIQSLDINPDSVIVKLKPIDSLLAEFKNMQAGGDREDTKVLKIRIAHYLRLLDSLYTSAQASNKGVSLAIYMQAVFEEASVLSQTSSSVLENEAAILALAIYAGNPRFHRFIGDLSFAIEEIPSAYPKPRLASREDLSLHFIYSAAIKLLSQKGISMAVGEFKELMDRAKGGSGYSFVDLAADLAGTHFADLAVQPETALHVQNVLKAKADENLFMVSISALEEGLSKQEFIDKYTEVDSPEYKRVVNEINKRLQNLPINKSIP